MDSFGIITGMKYRGINFNIQAFSIVLNSVGRKSPALKLCGLRGFYRNTRYYEYAQYIDIISLTDCKLGSKIVRGM